MSHPEGWSPSLTIEDLQRRFEGLQFIDLRTDEERLSGMLPGALALSGDALEKWIASNPFGHGEVVLYCASGARSKREIARLDPKGELGLMSLESGFLGWVKWGGQVIGAEDDGRYAPQIALPEIGPEGQRKLKNARVLIAGLGGLGSPIALYLAGAGVGTLVLADDDVVERSNLHRQVVHADHAVGSSKVSSALSRLQALNPSIRISGKEVRINSSNVDSMVSDVDLVIDGTDNFATRYTLNRACVKAGLPYVFGAIFKFEGQVGVFGGGTEGNPAACLRCLFPEELPTGLSPSCGEAGVLGVLPGIIGTLQAAEALKIILELPGVLRGEVLHYDVIGCSTRRMRVPKRPECPDCAACTE